MSRTLFSEDGGGGEDGFANYVDDSLDPGNAMLLATVIVSFLLIAMLPCIVSIGQRYYVHHEEYSGETESSRMEGGATSQKAGQSKDGPENDSQSEDESKSSSYRGGRNSYNQHQRGARGGKGGERRAGGGGNESSDDESSLGMGGVMGVSTSLGGGSVARRKKKKRDNDNDDDSDSVWSGAGSVASALANAILATSPHGGPIKRRTQMHILHREEQIELQEEQSVASSSFQKDGGGDNGSVLGPLSNDEVSIRDAVDAAPGRFAVYDDALDLMMSHHIHKGSGDIGGDHVTHYKGGWVEKLQVIAEYDYETRRILKLGLPFVMQALLIGTMETVRVALVGKLISTRALSAYVVVNLIVGMSNVFLKGFQDACTTLCSHAVGTGNKKLAGQYIQIATLFYIMCYIPIFLLWMFATGAIFDWLGFDDETKQIGEDFTLLFLFSSFLRGMSYSMHSLLDVIDRENYSTTFISCQEVVATLGVLVVALQPNVQDLQLVGLVLIVEEAFALIINSAIIVWNGWFDKYLDGLVGSLALLNVKATKVLLGTSVALSVGELVAYGEWELLTVFASVLGPAEVATWGLLGTLWDALELVTEAVADAGEVRTAFLLGAGRPGQAKLSSFKTLYLGVSASIFITACMFIAGEDIPTWLTNDPTLQRMTAELIPLFGIGNIALSIGTMSWTLVGAASRYRLATCVGLSGAWFVAIPMATVFTFVYNFDLQGQTAAIVIGYMVSGTVNTYILIQSDWPKLSRRVIEQAGGIVEDDDDDSSSSSSSSDSDDSSSSDDSQSTNPNNKVNADPRKPATGLQNGQGPGTGERHNLRRPV